MDITGLRAMIVGGASGMARATAERIAAGGGRVAVLDRAGTDGPAVAEALTPPDRGTETDWDALGANADEIRSFALGGLTRRLKLIGVPLETL